MLVQLESIGKVYEGAVPFRALSEVNVTLDEGEFVAIIGQSGSGKSTLLNILGTLDRATEGVHRVRGQVVSGLSDAEITRLRSQVIGFIFQFHYLLPDFTVMENILMPIACTGAKVTAAHRQEARRILDRVGVIDKDGRLASELSGGQQQRVAIARALMGGKSLVLADEPTGNLDSVTGEEVFQLMREFNREQGTTFVIVTHDQRIAERTDRILRIVDGRIAEDRRT